MDNGLIFPYPCAADRDETLMLRFLPNAFGRRAGHGPRGSRHAGGEPQEASSTGRWLSRGKGVGRPAGKSAGHEACDLMPSRKAKRVMPCCRENLRSEDV